MDLEGLVAEARERRPQPMPQRERVYAGISAAAFLGLSALLGAVLPDGQPLELLNVAVPVLLYALACRCQFEIVSGFALPNQLAFIPMLFLAPLPLVPLMVALGYLLARLPDFVLKRSHADRWMHCFGHAWFAVGPVAVIGLLAPGEPRLSAAAVYVAALAAQCAIGVAEVTIGDKILYGTAPIDTLRAGVWSFSIDVLLTPVAYMIAA
ncbi:MAG: hypothetical protein QOG63_866, partial [Thermoleophilaceae bacterium]|nr:hypothetical protein [Thermoleophilaceae bacterium]